MILLLGIKYSMRDLSCDVNYIHLTHIITASNAVIDDVTN